MTGKNGPIQAACHVSFLFFSHLFFSLLNSIFSSPALFFSPLPFSHLSSSLLLLSSLLTSLFPLVSLLESLMFNPQPEKCTLRAILVLKSCDFLATK